MAVIRTKSDWQRLFKIVKSSGTHIGLTVDVNSSTSLTGGFAAALANFYAVGRGKGANMPKMKGFSKADCESCIRK